ncbi:MAG: FkbM family methyltransferase [Bacteroidetes bacterium]|nr:FkbM family methyltransferase [Bacteroidota bacterium]
MHGLLAKLFLGKEAPKGINDTWKVEFLGKSLVLPMKSEKLWAHWHTAVSIVGTDVELKNFYEKLITSEYRPNYFFDIGTNYGTHSLLFLSQGVKVVSFEPNPDCHPSFDTLVKLNGLQHHLEKMALGDEDTTASLTFPKTDTGLGSLTSTQLSGFTHADDLEHINVKVQKLDTYLADKDYAPDFIKIDTEGFELKVFQGAEQTFRSKDLIVIFESLVTDVQRGPIHDFLTSIEYGLYDLRNLSAGKMSRVDYVNSQNINFLAINNSHPVLKDLKMFELYK